MLFHEKFTFTRPLTVTGAYLYLDGSIIFHQMVLERIENSNYILQNTLIGHSDPLLRIPLKRQYYASYEMMEDCLNCNNDYVYIGPNNEFCKLVNEHFNMKPETVTRRFTQNDDLHKRRFTQNDEFLIV